MISAPSDVAPLLIIDDRPLQRAQLSLFLREFARDHGLRLRAVGLSAAAPAQGDGPGGLCIVSAAGSPDESLWLDLVKRLREAQRSRPIVLFSESARARAVERALSAGAQGVVPSCTAPEIALRSLEFALHGGVYVPPTVLDDLKPSTAPPGCGKAVSIEATAKDRPILPAKTLDAPSQTRSFRAVDVAAGTGPDPCPDGRLTQRQRTVLVHLLDARSNKEIARILDTTEATVKVHVRQIMRKLGAKNRTEAALIAAQSHVVLPTLEHRGHIARVV